MRGMVAFACALVLATCAAAQAGGWPVVQALAAGSPVVVRVSRAASVKGRLVAVSDSGLDVLTSRGARRSIARARVTRVYLGRPSYKLRNALIGAGASFTWGDLFLFTHEEKYSDDSSGEVLNPRARVAAEFGAVCAVVGAALGAVLGLRRAKLIYKREPGAKLRDQVTARRKGLTVTAAPAGAAR